MSLREDIVRRFERIDASAEIATTPTDGLFMAESLLQLPPDGAVVECGCFAGGTTAKLSIVSRIVGRRLVVFDSFQGLPAVGPDHLLDAHARRSRAWVTPWTAGRYAASLERVAEVVKTYGELGVCQFVKGWFRETLTTEAVPDKIAFVFADVDVASSAQECLVGLWPKMVSQWWNLFLP